MQAVDQASTQLPNWGFVGQANNKDCRTSGPAFNDVMTITYSGNRKKAETLIKKA